VAAHIDRSDVELQHSVLVNQSVRLECVVEGVPSPVIAWFKDDRPLADRQTSRLRVVDNGQKLHISSVELTDGGTYECRAENEAGRDRLHYQLKVLGQF